MRKLLIGLIAIASVSTFAQIQSELREAAAITDLSTKDLANTVEIQVTKDFPIEMHGLYRPVLYAYGPMRSYFAVHSHRVSVPFNGSVFDSKPSCSLSPRYGNEVFTLLDKNLNPHVRISSTILALDELKAKFKEAGVDKYLKRVSYKEDESVMHGNYLEETDVYVKIMNDKSKNIIDEIIGNFYKHKVRLIADKKNFRGKVDFSNLGKYKHGSFIIKFSESEEPYFEEMRCNNVSTLKDLQKALGTKATFYVLPKNKDLRGVYQDNSERLESIKSSEDLFDKEQLGAEVQNS